METIKQVRSRLVTPLTEKQLQEGKKPHIRCSKCKFRVRGVNHEAGDHHNGRVKQSPRRRR
jgi:hypothetical protein